MFQFAQINLKKVKQEAPVPPLPSTTSDLEMLKLLWTLQLCFTCAPLVPVAFCPWLIGMALLLCIPLLSATTKEVQDEVPVPKSSAKSSSLRIHISGDISVGKSNIEKIYGTPELLVYDTN